MGVNFEDRQIVGLGLHPVAALARGISAIRAGADAEGLSLYINVRPDLFLQNSDSAPNKAWIGMTAERAQSCQDAGVN